MITIPTTSTPNTSQSTVLSGQAFVFTFHWNHRESAWYFDLADQDEVPIATARKIVVGFPLLPRCVDDRQPPGMLMAVDTAGKNQDPLLEDLGTRVQLIYFEPEDLVA